MTNDTLAAMQDAHVYKDGVCSCGTDRCDIGRLLVIMAARIDTREAIIDNEVEKKLAASAELARIVDEFGDYESLRQSRAICERRAAQVRAVVALANKWYLEDESVPFCLELREALLHA